MQSTVHYLLNKHWKGEVGKEREKSTANRIGNEPLTMTDVKLNSFTWCRVKKNNEGKVGE